MGFLTPLALAFAALGLPILLFYLLKLRRERAVVSSTLLWQQVLQDREANAPWQRLRRNLLLLLQLLLLFLLVMALARPYSEGNPFAPIPSGNLIVLLDASASMQATDVLPSRFEAARAVARQIIDGMGPNHTMTLIAVGNVPHVLAWGEPVRTTNDRATVAGRSTLRKALANAQVTNAQADWEAAFALAGSSAAASRTTNSDSTQRTGSPHATYAIILSDGGLPANLSANHMASHRLARTMPFAANGFNGGRGYRVQYVPIGTSAENLAISALAIRESQAIPVGVPQGSANSGSRDTRTAGPQAFVRVSNLGTQAANALLQINVDGRLFDARTLSVAPGGESSLSLDDLPLDARLIEARLKVDASTRNRCDPDCLSLDNTAWAVRAPVGHNTVLLTTPGNLFLDRAVGLLPGLDLITSQAPPQSPPKSGGRGAGAGGEGPEAQLYIYDGVLPATLPASGSLLFIAPPASTDLFTVTGWMTQTRVVAVDRDDPLLHYVDAASLMDDLQIAHARAIAQSPLFRTPIQAQGGPLLLAGTVNGRRVAVLAFDLHHSNLPLQIAFPILMANLIGWLSPASTAGASIDVYTSADADLDPNPSERVPPSIAPGMPVMLRLQGEHVRTGAGTRSALIIRSPSGRQWTYPVEGDKPIPFAETNELGVYTVTIEPTTSEFVVSESVVSDARAHWSVNLFSELESHIEPRDQNALFAIPAGNQGEHVRTDARTQGADAYPRGRREWWRWPALAGLVVLLIEWMAYQRGWTTSTLREAFSRRRTRASMPGRPDTRTRQDPGRPHRH
jgi:hypothetical protein